MQSLELPSIREAVALACVGFTGLVPRVSRNDRTGATVLTWFLRDNAPRALTLLNALENPDPAKNICRTHPEDGFLCAIYLQEIHSAILQWIRTAKRPAVLLASNKARLLRLLESAPRFDAYDLAPLHWSAAPPPVHAVANPLHAAVAILCGFVPHPQIDDSTGRPRILFAAESITFAGLRFDEISKASPTAAVGTHPVGEHPVCYALAAAANLIDFQKAAIAADKNPTHQYKGRGTKSALISENLINASAPAAFRDKLSRHLAFS